MRTFKHWNVPYLRDRLIEKSYRLCHPNMPWLTQVANTFLSYLVNPDYVGIEYGSGKSTIWFSKRVKELTSVEHNPVWYEFVTNKLKSGKLSNVNYHLFPRQDTIAPHLTDYVKIAKQFEPDSLDFVLVDGIYRDACIEASIPLLKIGGILIIDNINLYLPCSSRAPNSIPSNGKPASPGWENVRNKLFKWLCIWTSNGVTDTAIYIKTNE